MNKVIRRRILPVSFIVVILAVMTSTFAGANVWTFGSSGSGQNPFTPRGYMIKTGSGLQYLNSRYDNSSGSVQYTGVENGLTYIDAYTKDADGNLTNISYTLYALTDRNPTPGYTHLFAYKDGVYIEDFGSHIGTPIRSSDNSDYVGGVSNMWTIPVLDFKFDPGCFYEFGYLQGMRANNGITMTLAVDSKGRYTGYICSPFTAAEEARYNECQWLEYQFVSSYTQEYDASCADEQTMGFYYEINQVPMRFSVQTYADTSAWSDRAEEIRVFLAGISESDYSNNKYAHEATEALISVLDAGDAKVESEVKYKLQPDANAQMNSMLEELEKAYQDFLDSGKPKADLTEYNTLMVEAQTLYDKALTNVGTQIGQYNKQAVSELLAAIESTRDITVDNTQEEVDNASKILYEAIVKVKDSKIRNEMIVFVDRATGIIVRVHAGALPSDAVMIIRSLYPKNTDYEKLDKYLGKEDILKAYEIMFYVGDKLVYPSGNIQVQIPIVDLRDYDLSVYKVFTNADLDDSVNAADGAARQFVGKGQLHTASTANYIIAVSPGPGFFVITGVVDKTDDFTDNEDADGDISDGTQTEQENTSSDDSAEIVQETPIDLGKTPDLPEEFMNLGDGTGEPTPDIKIEGENITRVSLVEFDIPKNEIAIQGEENYLLLSTAGLGAIGLAVGVSGIVKKRR